MLMKYELVKEAIPGHKTNTRRIERSGDRAETIDGQVIAVYRNGRLKWRVGQTYALQMGRGKPTAHYAYGALGDLMLWDGYPKHWPDAKPARISITALRHERLQDITDEDLLAEGIDYNYVGQDQRMVRRATFRFLWDKINPQPLYRWATNPYVWVITFELVK